jgi:hypothetical protein
LELAGPGELSHTVFHGHPADSSEGGDKMPFVAVTTVSLEGFDPAEAQKRLQDVQVPRIKSLPGFQSARFVRSLDGKTGVGTVVFDTEDNAKAANDGIITQRPAEMPPVQSSAVYEVVLEV